jgi:hypothetical protein
MVTVRRLRSDGAVEPRAAVDGGCEEFSEAELVAIVRYLHTAAEVLRGFARSHPADPG